MYSLFLFECEASTAGEHSCAVCFGFIFYFFCSVLQPIQRRQPIKIYGEKKNTTVLRTQWQKAITTSKSLSLHLYSKSRVFVGLCACYAAAAPFNVYSVLMLLLLNASCFTSLRTHRVHDCCGFQILCCFVEYNVPRCASVPLCVSIRSSDERNWMRPLKNISSFDFLCWSMHHQPSCYVPTNAKNAPIQTSSRHSVTLQCSIEKQDYLWLAFISPLPDAIATKNTTMISYTASCMQIENVNFGLDITSWTTSFIRIFHEYWMFLFKNPLQQQKAEILIIPKIRSKKILYTSNRLILLLSAHVCGSSSFMCHPTWHTRAVEQFARRKKSSDRNGIRNRFIFFFFLHCSIRAVVITKHHRRHN